MNAAGCRSPPWPSNGTRGGGGAVQCTHSTVQCTLWLPPYKRPGAIRPTVADVEGGEEEVVRGWRRRRWRGDREVDKWFGWHHEKAHRIQPMKKRFPSSQAVAPSKSNQTSTLSSPSPSTGRSSLQTPPSKCPLYNRGSVEQDTYEAVIKNIF